MCNHVGERYGLTHPQRDGQSALDRWMAFLPWVFHRRQISRTSAERPLTSFSRIGDVPESRRSFGEVAKPGLAGREPRELVES